MVYFPWKQWPKRPLPRRMRNPQQGNRPRTIVPLKQWHVVKGDKVEILAGKDLGKQGTVTDVIRRYNQVYVEGLNTEAKYLPPYKDFKGGYIAEEKPLHIRDVKLVDPSTGKSTDIIFRYTGEGKRVRVSLDSGRIIAKPIFQRADFKTRSEVQDGDFDTAADDASRSSYVPSLLLFHEEIMKELNVKPSILKQAPERRDLIAEQLIKEGEIEAKERELLKPEDVGLRARTYTLAQNVLSRIKFWS